MTQTPMEDQESYLKQGLANAREAARELARCDDDTIRSVLYELAEKAQTIMATAEEVEGRRLAKGCPDRDPDDPGRHR